MSLSRPALAVLLLSSLAAVSWAQTMRSPRLEARLDARSGMVRSLVDRSDGLVLLQPSPDRYVLQPGPEQSLTASETDDQVIERRGDTFLCTNPSLPGLRLEKSYTLSGRYLTKRVRFLVTGLNLGLLKYSTGSVVGTDLYRDAYLNDPSRHPLDNPYPPTSSFTTERQMVDAHAVADHHLVILTNLARKRGLAQYRFKVDGRFVHPLSSYSYEPGLYYGPTGWRLAVAAKWLSRDRPPLECEVRWHLFDGDHVAFHQEYLALPENVREWDWPSPAWLKDVRNVASWVWTESSPDVSYLKTLADSLSDGYLMVMLHGIFPNTRDYLSDPIPAPAVVPLPAAELRRIVDELHALSPRIKVGPVTWQWAFADLDPIYRTHPEWTVHDGAGQAVFAASGWSNERVYSQLLTPACRKFILGQYQGMVKRYDFDFIYMDTGQGGVTRFDWNTHWGAQDYDWADLYRGIRDAARSNREGATFFNGTPRLYSQYADCGYFEGMGFIKPHDWRAMADRLFLVKLYQPGDKWTMPLYWTDDSRESYAAYCLALAVKPGDFGEGAVTIRRWPLVAAANELSEARLAPRANVSPCWWREPTELEAYGLTLPGGALLTAISHERQSVTATLAGDLRPLGLDPARPVHVWLMRPDTVAQVESTTRVSRAQAEALYAQTGNAAHCCTPAEFLGNLRFADGRAQVSFPLDPDRVALVLLTQAPRLATAVEGRPRQLLLPPPPGVRVETVPADQPLPAALIARREGYQPPADLSTPLLVPVRSAPETVKRSTTEVNRRVAGLSVRRLLTVECEHNPANRAQVTLRDDPDAIRLQVDLGARNVFGFAGAAVEAEGAGTLRLQARVGRPLYGKFKLTPGCFVGLVADYWTGQAYTHRVRFALGPVGTAALTSSRPWWGVFSTDPAVAQAEWVDLSAATPPGEERELTLDLGRYAPEGWTGQVVLGAQAESSGLGTTLAVSILGNGPAGPRDPRAFSRPPAPPAQGTVAATFQSANIYQFESGAEVRKDRLFFPANGLIEAEGLRVTRWSLSRDATSRAAELWVNFQRADQHYELHKRSLNDVIQPGRQGTLDLDLGQLAPADWTGRVRIRLVGDGVTAELVANSTFQIF